MISTQSGVRCNYYTSPSPEGNINYSIVLAKWKKKCSHLIAGAW